MTPREKKLAAHRAWRARNPEKLRLSVRRSNMKHRYGITLEQYDEMILASNGQCGLCDRQFRSAKDAHIDHCHAGHQVRDILCGTCNTGLGMFYDDPALMRRAADYLESHR